MGKVSKTKALFIQRLGAFLIDIMLVSMFASLITVPFTKENHNDKLAERAIEIQQQYMDKKITIEDYMDEYSSIYYKMSRNNGLLSLVIIILNILYFIVYQFYNDGRTMGKKLMGIKVVSDDKDLNMDQLVLRSLIANFILVDIIVFVFMLFVPSNLFIYCAGFVQLIQYIVVFISVFMIMFRKDGRGLHDIFTRTKVIRN